MNSTKTIAVAYFRTSSATGVGDDKDSLLRQQDAVRKFAQRNNYEIAKEWYDAAVKGTDSVMDRPGFSELIDYILVNGITTILVENASRFARDLIVQLTGHDFLKKNGISILPVDAPDYFTDETPTAIMIRQILGAVAEFEKRSLVDRMAKGRLRKKKETGRCEGRKPPPAEAVKLAKELHEQGGYSLRAISAELAAAGYTVMLKGKPTGKEYPPTSIKLMLESDDQ